MTPREKRSNYSRELERIKNSLKRKQDAVKRAWLKEEDGDVVYHPNHLPVHRKFEGGFLTKESMELLDESKFAQI